MAKTQAKIVREALQAPATISVPEAGTVLGLSRNAAYAAAARGEIPVLRIGGRLLVPMAALQRLLETAGQTGAAT